MILPHGADYGNNPDPDMWRRTQNFFHSLVTHGVLSPDLLLRCQVNCKLRNRLALAQDEWFKTFWQRESISPALSEFVYQHIPEYSGLQVARLKPTDRLEADLYWTQVCWFDWEMDLYDDVLQCFGKDISEEFDFDTVRTLDDLMQKLACYLGL
ncbi:MAG: hypothetical protein AAGD25_35720 [Cyanobacteria bacterium P01_F01_bin.150]